MYYLNRFEELREAIHSMRIPEIFVRGPKEANRQLEAERRVRVKKYAAKFAPKKKTPSEEWEVFSGGFSFRGVTYAMQTSSRLQILELLATSPRAVSCNQIETIIGHRGDPTRRVYIHIHELRNRLRKLFGLPKEFDPVPCVERGRGGAWTLAIT